MTSDDELVREMARADWNAIREVKPHLPGWDELTREQIETGMLGSRAALARYREILEADGYRMVRVVKRERIPFTLDEDA